MYNIYITEISERKKEKNRKNIWINNNWEFPQINIRQQNTYPGNSENIKQNKFYKIFTHRHIIFKLHIIQDKENILKGARGKNMYRGRKIYNNYF